MEQVAQTNAFFKPMAAQKKWVDGVLKMIQLTQGGSLVWKLADPEAGFAYAYHAPFEGNIVIFERTLLFDVPQQFNGPLASALFGIAKIGANEKIALKVQKPDGELLMQFPMISPLRGLAAAIEEQLSRESDAFLAALAAA